ncbi:MAG: glycosyltransferase family 2 protein [Sedimentitalea sp.]|uniref:glycosyltransferase family 2 protein n=1 Tax=Sedimentitalea sp. TaxID=2048915 RepID=UPI0032665BF6
MTVISLTSIPPRFDLLQSTLDSLVKQDIEIREIRVNIPKSYKRFPEGSFSLPITPEGVKVVEVEHDLGPATKLLPALNDCRSMDEAIIYCDDDRTVSEKWARNLIDAAHKHPKHCIANSGWDIVNLGFAPKYDARFSKRAIQLSSRWDLSYRAQRLEQKIHEFRLGQKLPKPYRTRNYRRTGYIDIMEGCGGVLVRPSFFSSDVFSVPEKLWMVDDIWLSGMAAHNGIPILANNGYMPRELANAMDDALCDSTIEGLNRQQANVECVRFMQREYGIWETE